MRVRTYQHPRYTKGARDCFRDPCRDFLVIATPEEVVRQDAIRTLIDDYGYPADCLGTEVKIARGRADLKRSDIVVYGRRAGELEDERSPLIVVECKRPEVSISQEVLEQGLYYARKLNAPYLVLTNGMDMEAECYHLVAGKPIRIQDIPTYDESRRLEGWAPRHVVPDSYVRPSFEQISNLEDVKEDFLDHIGVDTPQKLWGPIANVVSLFLSDEPWFEAPFDGMAGYTFIEDWKARFHEFSNAGGSGWWGWYRSLLVRDAADGDHLVRLAIYSSRKTENDPHWGNREGNSLFLVAVSDLDYTHHSLQLNVDRFWELDPDTMRMTVWHNGANGGRGSIKRDVFLEQIREAAPELVVDGLVHLGSFPVDRLIEWADIKDVVVRACVYALLRDKVRSQEPRRVTETDSKPRKTVREQVAEALDDSYRLEKTNRSGHTPLIIAAAKGYDDLVEALLAKGACVNVRDKSGRSPLMYASMKNRVRILEMLVTHEASLDTQDDRGKTALVLALEEGARDAARYLVSHGATPKIVPAKALAPLFLAIQLGDADLAEAILQTEADLRQVDEEGRTPLMLAIEQRLSALAATLIAANSPLDAADKSGKTALMYAAEANDLHTSRLLLARGADKDVADVDGWTALIYASKDADEQVVRLLLATGARVNARSATGETPLIWAVDAGDPKKVEALIEASGDAHVKMEDGRDCLSVASGYGYLGLVRRFLALGLDVNTTDNQGITPLMVAVSNGHEEVALHLLQAGAEVNAADQDGWTALMWAALEGSAVLAWLLLDHGADPQAVEGDGRTALDIAEEEEHSSFVEALRKRLSPAPSPRDGL